MTTVKQDVEFTDVVWQAAQTGTFMKMRKDVFDMRLFFFCKKCYTFSVIQKRTENICYAKQGGKIPLLTKGSHFATQNKEELWSLI